MSLLAYGTDEDLRDSALEAVRSYHCSVCGTPQTIWWMPKWKRRQCKNNCGYFRRSTESGVVKFYRIHEAWNRPAMPAQDADGVLDMRAALLEGLPLEHIGGNGGRR